jgi:hypothetical protein
MLPLLVAYEAALWHQPSAPRNAGELWIDRILLPFGERAHVARWVLLALGALCAFVIARAARRGDPRRDRARRARRRRSGVRARPLMVIAITRSIATCRRWMCPGIRRRIRPRWSTRRWCSARALGRATFRVGA